MEKAKPSQSTCRILSAQPKAPLCERSKPHQASASPYMYLTQDAHTPEQQGGQDGTQGGGQQGTRLSNTRVRAARRKQEGEGSKDRLPSRNPFCFGPCIYVITFTRHSPKRTFKTKVRQKSPSHAHYVQRLHYVVTEH